MNNNLANNSIKNQAYFNELQNNDLLPLIKLDEDGSYSVNYNPPLNPKPTMANKLGLGITNFRQGFNENLLTPYSAESLKHSDNSSISRKLGEGLGTAARWLDNPLVRGLIAGGLTYLDGGSGMDALKYGLTATVLNQNVKTADRLYRKKLHDMGYSDDEINTLPGYVNHDTFKNVMDSDYRSNMINLGQFKAINDNKYHINKLDLDNRKLEHDIDYHTNQLDLNNRKLEHDIDYHNNLIEQKKAQNFITNQDYYKQLLSQNMISQKEYFDIVNNPQYNPDELINLNALNAVISVNENKMNQKKVEDQLKTNRQKRYYNYKNNGKNVMRVEYDKKPDSQSNVHVFYHGEKPGYNPPVTSPDSKQKSEYNDIYNKHHPKKTKGGKIF